MTTKSRIYFPKRGKQRRLAKIKRTDRDRRAFKRAAYGKPIAKVSERQKRRLAEYARVKRKFLKEHPYCYLCETSGWPEFSGESGKATEVLLTYTNDFLACCRRHRNWIHANVGKARKMGLIGPWGKQTP